MQSPSSSSASSTSKYYSPNRQSPWHSRSPSRSPSPQFSPETYRENPHLRHECNTEDANLSPKSDNATNPSSDTEFQIKLRYRASDEEEKQTFLKLGRSVKKLVRSKLQNLADRRKARKSRLRQEMALNPPTAPKAKRKKHETAYWAYYLPNQISDEDS